MGEKYFIHGNGLDLSCCPVGMKAHELPGHGQAIKDRKLYKLAELTNYFLEKVPHGAQVWGHSLGAHIALNLAQHREDISVVCFGMAPLDGVADMGTLMTPVPEFVAFQNPQRTQEDLKNFIAYSALGNESIAQRLLNAALKQDPFFNAVLFTEGIVEYDWNEKKKAKALGDRITFVISKKEMSYNYDLFCQLELNLIEDHYAGHCPWLFDDQWFEKISIKILAQKTTSLYGNTTARTSPEFN